MVRVFPFILKTKHKTLHVKRACAELENFAEKQSARASINRVRQIYTVNSAEHSIPILHINTLWTSLKQRLKRFDHDLPTLQIEVLIHLNLKSSNPTVHKIACT